MGNIHPYSIYICACGRIHTFPYEHVKWIQSKGTNRSLITVCTNCGKTIKRVYHQDYFPRVSYNNNPKYQAGYIEQIVIRRATIDKSPGEDTVIIFDNGFRVPLESGEYANTYSDGIFKCMTHDSSESTGCIRCHPKYTTVDTLKLIGEIENVDILKSLAQCRTCINWVGTAYEKELQLWDV